MLQTAKITVSGQVQGVGFRPYVFNLAHKYQLKGTVSNNQQGVIIYASGIHNKITDFYAELIKKPPPVAQIKNSNIVPIDFIDFNTFEIIPSQKNGALNLPLTPDFAICDNCKKELSDTANRRYNYPFTTCVNCGPRWAITETFSFERAHTSINKFPMCTTCEKEYTSPINRRFHSQTNTCKTCGIELKLVTNKGIEVDLTKNNVFKLTASLLAKGNIIAIKNTGGYLLCCNAENTNAIKKLRQRKKRPRKPFAVLYPSLKYLQKELKLTQNHIKSLTSTQLPISIISLKNYKGTIALQEIAPGLTQLGVMLPYSGILQLLANELNFPIVATSGNIHGSPILNLNNEAQENLKNVADYFVTHSLKITQPQDDSVIKYSSKFNQEVLFRRSRGYAPNFFNASISSNHKILAMGAHLKSTIAFYPNEYLYISQYLGNLDNFNVYNRFTKTTQTFINLFEQQPNVILTDKHNGYHSTQYGKELANKYNANITKIQHHKAHFTAILGEHNLFKNKVLGVIFDGTGLGDDGAIWGGEFLKYENKAIDRVNHLTYFNWLLADKMAKEPRLSLLSLASDTIIESISYKFSKSELKTYTTLKKQNKLKTSSVGRLFDAVASLLNITDYNSYEGEAAILLENLIENYDLNDCKNYLESSEFNPSEIIYAIYKETVNGAKIEQIAINFLYTIANYIVKFALNNKYKHVAFSGGVFQNTTLVDMLIELASTKIKLYFHKDLSPNDENISFGQIMYYLHIKN